MWKEIQLERKLLYVIKAENYRHSSALSHVKRVNNAILSDFCLIHQIVDWQKYLEEQDNKEKIVELRRNQETGRPLGESSFVKDLELITGIELVKKKPGPKIKIQATV